MKPKKLVMSAFGSYGGVETIDFDLLNHGLFLIAGDTGAGKSTIFDAIMFALYDTMSGKDRKGHMMRSEYARDEAETFVEFTFSYGTASEMQTYTVRRYPSYFRRAKRKNKQGDYGLTKQPAKISLIMPDGKEYVGKMVQVNQKIQEIIGLTAEQFSKIAMIAQGEFQELIMDKTGRRKEIFQQIFSTEIYEKIERKIFEQFKKSHVAMKENITQLREAIKNASFDREGELSKWKEILEYIETEPERIEDFLEKNVSNLHVTVKKQEKELQSLERQIVQANQKYQTMLSINRDIDEYEKELEVQEKLLSQKTDIEYLQQQQILVRKAKEIKEQENAYLRCCEDLRQAKNKNDEQEKTEELLRSKWNKALHLKEEKQNAYQKEEPENIKLQNQLLEQLEVFSELIKCRSDLQLEEKKYAKEEEDFLKLEEQIEQYERNSTNLKKWIEEHSDLEVSIEQAKQKRVRTTEQKEKLEEFDDAYHDFCESRKHLHETEKEYLQILQKWESSRRAYEEMNHAYIAAQSSFLAMELESGSPCPVCGSVEHPRPAQRVADHVTKEALDSSQEKEQKCQKLKEDYQLSVESQRAIVRKMGQDLSCEAEKLFEEVRNGKESLDAIFVEGLIQSAYQKNQEEVETLKQELLQLQKLQEESGEKKKGIEEAKTKIQESQQKLQEKKESMHQAEIRKNGLVTQEKILKNKVTVSSLEEGERELNRLKERFKLLRSEVAKAEENEVQCRKAYDTLLGNREENQRLIEKLSREEKALRDIFQKSMRENELEEEDYHAALALCEGQEIRERKIQEYQMQKVQNDTRLNTLRERIAGQEKVSVDEVSGQITALQQKKQTEEERYHSVSYRHRINSEVLKRVKLLLADQDSLLRDKRIIASLNDVANGRIRFQTYVQRQYFKKIIHAANQRLRRMTANQFLLQCRELDKAGQGESGLDLDVYNPVTGKSRDAHTLSGGETFLASLSMALGMADVVQNTVGKTHLDTMFIDEGFGSLSEEVRNTAVRVLLELAGDNRLVGVISHVSELKEQIPNKLVVTKGNCGSKVNWRKD